MAAALAGLAGMELLPHNCVAREFRDDGKGIASLCVFFGGDI